MPLGLSPETRGNRQGIWQFPVSEPSPGNEQAAPQNLLFCKDETYTALEYQLNVQKGRRSIVIGTGELIKRTLIT